MQYNIKKQTNKQTKLKRPCILLFCFAKTKHNGSVDLRETWILNNTEIIC